MIFCEYVDEPYIAILLQTVPLFSAGELQKLTEASKSSKKARYIMWIHSNSRSSNLTPSKRTICDLLLMTNSDVGQYLHGDIIKVAPVTYPVPFNALAGGDSL